MQCAWFTRSSPQFPVSSLNDYHPLSLTPCGLADRVQDAKGLVWRGHPQFHVSSLNDFHSHSLTTGSLWYLVEDVVRLIHKVISTVLCVLPEWLSPDPSLTPCSLEDLVEDAVHLVCEVISIVPYVLFEQLSSSLFNTTRPLVPSRRRSAHCLRGHLHRFLCPPWVALTVSLTS